MCVGVGGGGGNSIGIVKGVNQWFCSHLGCSGQRTVTVLLVVKVSFRMP